MLTILNSPDGKVRGLNKQALQRIPFCLVPNYPNNPVALTASAPAGPIAMTVSGEGPAQIVSLQQIVTVALPNVNMLILFKMQEGRNFRQLMNGQINMNTIFGTNQTPYPMPEPLYIDETRRLSMEFTEAAGGAANFFPAAWCVKSTSVEADPTLEMARKRQDFRQFLSFPYWYTLDEGRITLTGTTTFERVITIGYDHHFMLHMLSAVFEGTSAATGFNVDIIDVAKGDSLFYAPQGNHFGADSRILFGDGNYPYEFIAPRLFMTGQKILLRLRNNVAGTNNLWATLSGRAIADRMWR
jgi:hypothetical protein